MGQQVAAQCVPLCCAAACVCLHVDAVGRTPGVLTVCSCVLHMRLCVGLQLCMRMYLLCTYQRCR